MTPEESISTTRLILEEHRLGILDDEETGRALFEHLFDNPERPTVD